MIVYEKSDEAEIYGAVRFNRTEANKTLMNYPGVKVKSSHSKLVANSQGVEASIVNEYALNGETVSDGDYLVTDKRGYTTIYSPSKFKDKFKRVGDENGVS